MTKFTVGYSGMGVTGSNSTFNKVFDSYKSVNQVQDLNDCDAIVLWGGIDIHPSFYKQKLHPKNQQNDNEPIERDYAEWLLIREAHKRNKLIIGICRGAQMLCAYAGGSLYQHVTGHNSPHSISTYDDQEFTAPATHHQMMNLDGTTYDLLAWSTSDRSAKYEREEDGVNLPGEHLKNKEGEPEVVWFPNIKGLAIQPHPEWAMDNSPFKLWVERIITEKLL